MNSKNHRENQNNSTCQQLICDISSQFVGKHISIVGWVSKLIKLKTVTFIVVCDNTGLLQVTIKNKTSNQNEITKNSIIQARGILQKSKSHDFEFELAAQSITVISKAIHQSPLDMNSNISYLDTRLNSRSLDIRNPKTAAIFKIRHNALISIRASLIQKGFIEITTPKIIGNAAEGGANLFSMKYFGNDAYLAQSPQLYKEQMMLGFNQVFEIATFYRSEKSHTLKHLSEFTSVDIECAFVNYSDIMNLVESIIKNLYEFILHNCKQEISIINTKIPDSYKRPFKRFTYSQIVEKLQNNDVGIKFGDDLLDSHLKLIGNLHPEFYFITDWPLKIKPFYINEKYENDHLSQSFDLQYGDIEISSGGTRIYSYQKLKNRMIDQNLDPSDFENHLNVFNWGMPPHAGCGIGLDRLMMVLTNNKNIRETVLYPRDPNRLFP